MKAKKKNLGMKASHRLTVSVKLVFFTFCSLVVMIPFLYLLSSAFKPGSEMNTWPPSFIPKTFTLGNYKTLFDTAPFGRFFLNSLGMASISAVGILLTSTLSGYVFGKFKFKLNNFLFGLVFSTSIIPFEIYMVPLYIEMVKYKLNNTFIGLVLPYLVMSFGIFFMRQMVIQQVPDELIEAARIDGCHEYGIFFKIVLPLLRSGIAALGILAFVEGWNAFVWPLIMVSDNQLFTMEIGLALFQTTFNVDLGAVAAGSLFSIAPILLVFLIFRRQIMESIALTGIKG